MVAAQHYCKMRTMRSTLARPGPARPITVLLVLLALDAGGAMAQCCDPDSGSLLSTPTYIACTDYPEGRAGRLWNGNTVCLSHKQTGYPKTAAGVLPALDRLCTVVAQRKTNANLSNPPACPLPLAPCTRPPPTAPCCPGSVRVPPPCLYRDRQSSLSNLCPRYMPRAQSFRHSCHSPHCPPCADFLR